MFAPKPIRFLIVSLMLALFFASSSARAQQNQVMGELQFSGTTKIERNSGVWVDGQYVGYLKELKGDKKVMLMPGDHEISVRQAGYQDFTKRIVVEPGQVQPFPVTMTKDSQGAIPGRKRRGIEAQRNARTRGRLCG